MEFLFGYWLGAVIVVVFFFYLREKGYITVTSPRKHTQINRHKGDAE